MFGKAYSPRNEGDSETPSRTIVLILVLILVLVLALARSTLGQILIGTGRTATVRATEGRNNTVALKHLGGAHLTLYATLARNLAIMLLAAQNERRIRSVRNADQKLRFSRYSNANRGLALALALLLALDRPLKSQPI